MIKHIAALLLVFAPLAAPAHHSTALNFSQETRTLEGTVTDLKWVNPHANFVLEVENDDGVTERWLVEMLAVIALERSGFEFDLLEEGMEITLTGRLGYRDRQILFGEAIVPGGRVLRRRGPSLEQVGQ